MLENGCYNRTADSRPRFENLSENFEMSLSHLFVGLWLLGCACFSWGTTAGLAQEQPVADSADRDYSGELPRIPPKSPEEALKTFTVAAGFRIEQVAAEPLVTDPIAMSFDENGRLFVVEMKDYSEQDKEQLGQIRLLTDSDGDGRFDKSTIYIDGLSWPTAVIAYDGGIFVAAPPDIHYFKDTDGDGRASGPADERRVVFTGFGRGNVQGLVNTLLWGLDNRIHGATSSSGAEISKPGVEGPPLVLRGRDFAFDPKTLKIEATSGGAQHGISFNTWGEKFACSNSDHIQQVMFDDRYLARNPYLAAPGPRISIAADGPQATVFRTSPIEPWRIVRTRLRVKGVVPGMVEGGGKPAGYFTGATGVTIFRGTAWPAEFQNWALIGDVGSNLIHRKRLDANGLAYVARRVDEKSEFLSSSDIWFRPVQFANAPDGGLYIADMYREVIEHPASLPPPIKKHLDLTSGRDRGRIYRVVGENFRQPALPKLGQAAIADLVATLDHPNGWHRDAAARLLYQQQDPAAVPLLEKLAAAGSPLGRIYALHALAGMNALAADVTLAALRSEHPRVVEHAIRLSEKLAADSPELRVQLLALASADDPHVRYQLAFSLGELPNTNARNRALAALARRAANDPWQRLAIRSSLVEGSGEVFSILAGEAGFLGTESGKAMLLELATQIGKQQRPDDLAMLFRRLQDSKGNDDILKLAVQGLSPKAGTPLAEQLAAATAGRADELTQRLVADAAATAADSDQPLEQRVQAIQTLALGTADQTRAVLAGLIEPVQPFEVQQAALAALGRIDDPEIGRLLIGRWKSLSPRLRSQAGDVLFSRSAWLSLLLDALDAKTIAVGDLQPGRLQLLATNPDEAIAGRAKKLAGSASTGPRAEVVEAYRPALQLAGDKVRGKELFKKNCSGCHQAEGVGFAIGPNLAAMRNRGAEAIFTNVLAPNREVNPEFLNYAAITTDGRTLTGMISGETATSLTLRRADDKSDTLLRVEIDELRSTGLSLMPEGLEKELNQQALADVIAYLLSL